MSSQVKLDSKSIDVGLFVEETLKKTLYKYDFSTDDLERTFTDVLDNEKSQCLSG